MDEQSVQMFLFIGPLRASITVKWWHDFDVPFMQCRLPINQHNFVLRTCSIAITRHLSRSYFVSIKAVELLKKKVIDLKGYCTVVEAQLVELSLPIQRSAVWIQSSAKIYIGHLFTVNSIEKTKINKKRPGMAHFFKKQIVCVEREIIIFVTHSFFLSFNLFQDLLFSLFFSPHFPQQKTVLDC